MNPLFTSKVVPLPTQPGETSKLSMRTKARRLPLPSFEIFGTLLLMRMTTSVNISLPSKNTGNASTWLMTTISRSRKSNSRLLSSLPYCHHGTASHGCTSVSKRAILPTLKFMRHPRNLSEYSRRRTCDICDMLGKPKNRRRSTRHIPPSLLSPVAFKTVTIKMPNAVANVACVAT